MFSSAVRQGAPAGKLFGAAAYLAKKQEQERVRQLQSYTAARAATPGSSVSGIANRKKSLGLAALMNTYGMNEGERKEIVGGNVRKHEYISPDARNARLAQAKELYEASKPAPDVSSETDTPKSTDRSGREFNWGREDKEVGVGNFQTFAKPFNKKNPRQREVQPFGGPIRL